VVDDDDVGGDPEALHSQNGAAQSAGGP
jgi:hypothetical protein